MKLIFLLLIITLSACNPTSSPAPAGGGSSDGGTDSSSGGSGSSGTSSTTPGWSFPSSSSSVQYAFMGLSYTYSALTGLSGGGWALSSSQALPAGLSLSLVGTTAVISGIPTVASAQLNGLVITATKAAVTTTKQFTLIVKGDLLRPYQWHLENDGTSFFSGNDGVADEDMDVSEVWQSGVFGAGIRVAVSDSGLETSHADLSVNLITGAHRNYKNGSSSNGYLGTPSTFGEAHGTAVSGIIAAVGWNNIGGTGIAPQARLAGFQFIESNQSTSIMISQATGDFEVFNYSYGSGANFDFEVDELYAAHLRDRVTNGRSGKGQIYVKAAGNEYSGFCDTHGVLGLGQICAPQNANIPLDNNIPYIMLVSATNADGVAASYSNAGSNVWVSAPGGEYGDDDPAIVTTDLSSCAQGYSTTTSGPFAFNQFERYSGNNSTFLTYNPSCDYTSTMNGTSSAAPNVTGVVALLLSANPNLTWRDVKHILASTADQVHPAAGNTDHYEPALRLAGYTYEQGWVTNAAGYNFHNWYGFGRVNAAAAVTMATSGYINLPTWFESNVDFDDAGEGETGLSVAVPDATAAGVTRTLDIDLPGKIVETVQIKIQVTHPQSGQIGVELVSPDGTKSIMLNINNALFVPYDTGYDPDEDLDLVLTSNAFYGENADGNWTVRVIDGYSDSQGGTITGWSINILGH